MTIHVLWKYIVGIKKELAAAKKKARKIHPFITLKATNVLDK